MTPFNTQSTLWVVSGRDCSVGSGRLELNTLGYAYSLVGATTRNRSLKRDPHVFAVWCQGAADAEITVPSAGSCPVLVTVQLRVLRLLTRVPLF